KKYLDFCYYILDAWEQDNGPKIISSLLATGNVAKVGNGKAYEMLSNFVGLVKLYQVTGDEKLLKPVLIAWQDIVDKKMYITGTTSSREHFQGDGDLPATEKDNMGEGCVTTTWLQLNQNLLAVTGDLKYYDQIEKSIYNHLLAAENPETGCVSYYTPLMGKKPYTCFITCCQSSVPRGIALIPNFTFGNIKNVPTLMQYESATYKEKIVATDGKSVDLSLKIEGGFPENGSAVITVNVSKSTDFPINLRVPSWSTAFVAKIGDKTYNGKVNDYLEIKRHWKSGDKINVTFLMPIQTVDGGKNYPNQIAFQRGPQVLAFDDALNTKPTFETGQNYVHYTFESKIFTELLPKQWIGNQVYKVKIKNNQSINLVPFADASQTGGELKVWLPLSKPN
ncbi:MAG: glycoside hydrolase family 127 protein, partial [Flavobacteriaceae bacterium]|nr:glycoside hydrolase family 127 protein [Flavobacteriaceae bacterium]